MGDDNIDYRLLKRAIHMCWPRGSSYPSIVNAMGWADNLYNRVCSLERPAEISLTFRDDLQEGVADSELSLEWKLLLDGGDVVGKYACDNPTYRHLDEFRRYIEDIYAVCIDAYDFKNAKSDDKHVKILRISLDPEEEF